MDFTILVHSLLLATTPKYQFHGHNTSKMKGFTYIQLTVRQSQNLITFTLSFITLLAFTNTMNTMIQGWIFNM